MSKRYIFPIVWTAFLLAGSLEILIFAFFDPHDAHWLGRPLELSRQGIYSLSFFIFWALAIAANSLTVFLIADKSTQTQIQTDSPKN